MVEKKLTERIGIHKVALCFLEKFGWIEREQYVADYGIDTQVEIVENNVPTGLLYCLQVKAGKSYIKKSNDNIVFYPEKKHVEYWLNHSLPVILIICDLEKNKNYWEFLNPQTIKETERGWKINIPLDNLLDHEEAKYKISQYYYNNKKFTIMESVDDTSHPLSRRVSMKVVLKGDVAKVVMEKQLPHLIEGLKKSDYYRSKIVEKHHKDKQADCVWVYFYKDLEQYKNGLPLCIAYWNDPKSKSPTVLSSDDKEVNGIFIRWSQIEIPDEFFNDRLTKGKYLNIIDNYISNVEKIFFDISSTYENYKMNKSISSLKSKILKTKIIHDKLFPKEFHEKLPPLECVDLDQYIQNIFSSIDNIYIVLQDKKRNERNLCYCIEMYIKAYNEDFSSVRHERKKVT